MPPASTAVADGMNDLAVPAASTKHRLLLAVLLVEAAVLFAPTVAWLFDRWTLSVWQHAHGLLIPPIVGYFVYQELKPLAALPRSSSALGLPVSRAGAGVARARCRHAHAAAVSSGAHARRSRVCLCCCSGPGAPRAIAFPLAFLAFSLPIPLAFTEQIHWQLRQIATAGTSAIVPLLGIPLFVEGTTLHMANGALEVADACSGFSTLYAAVAVAALTAYSTRSPMRRAVVLLSAVPLAIAANLLRVIALVLLVVWQGPAILETFVHPLSGLATFALALPVIFWLGEDRRGAAR